MQPLDAGPLPPCRVVTGEGDVTPRSDPTTWLALGEKTSFVVRATESGREVRFVGPGRVVPCAPRTEIDVGDVAVLASGTMIVTPGAGESPGHEAWLATPCGAIRAAASSHKVAVSSTECVITTSSGTLFFAPAADVTVRELEMAADAGAPRGRALPATAESPWWRLDGRTEVRARTTRKALVSATSLADASKACDVATANERALAIRIRGLDGGSLSAVGELTAEHVEVRRRARAACAAARARGR